MKQISIRQLSCFCGFALMSFKYLSLPSLMYAFNEGGGLFTALTLLVMDILMILLAVAIKIKFPNHSLYDLIRLKLGKIVAKIFYVVLAVVFLCQMAFLINEASRYMQDVVNEETTNYYVLLILLPIVSCMVKNGIKNFARTMEFIFSFVIVGFFLCLVLGEGTIGFGHLGPFFAGGFSRFFDSLFSLSFFFTDFLFIYMILDKVQVHKKDFRFLYATILIVGILLAILYINYFKLYSITANFHKNAIADVTQYRRIIGNVGNLDILVILFVFFSLFFQSAIIFYALTDIYTKVMGYDNIIHPIIVFNLLIIALEYLLFTNLAIITNMNIYIMKYFSILLFVFLPIYLLFLLIFAKKEEKKYANYKKYIS